MEMYNGESNQSLKSCFKWFTPIRAYASGSVGI